MTTPRADDGIDHRDLPPIFCSGAQGTCLEPEIMDGTTLVFSTVHRPKAGDFVALWYRPGMQPTGAEQRQVKRLVLGLPDDLDFAAYEKPAHGFEPLIVVEMLNPPRQMVVPVSRLLAIHRVMGKAQMVAGRPCFSRALVEEAEALAAGYEVAARAA